MTARLQQCRRRGRRPAYVLVMVLALLVLSTTLLVAVSRGALRAAADARDAADNLQQRWGATSCERALLPDAEKILGALEQERRRPTARCATSIRLGGVTFELILADEQAKANVNAILRDTDVAAAQSRLQTALSGSGLLNRIKLRPTAGAVAGVVRGGTAPVVDDRAPAVGGWGQVFDGVSAVQLIRATPGSRTAPVDLLTCWGNGAINIRRAPEAAITLAGGRSLAGAEVSRLVEARDALFKRQASDHSFDHDAAEGLRDLVVRTSAEVVRRRGNVGLVEGSTCHSLWVITRTGRRDGYDLLVSDERDPARPIVSRFSW